jgi:hypothetical protein
MKLLITIAATAATLAAASMAMAVDLVFNGDFEIISTEDDAPVLDGYGLEQPTDWFRAQSDSGAIPTPVTELISPANMNNAAGNALGDDSNGAGTNSAALNFSEDPGVPPLGIPSDWRSRSIKTTPGEKLIFSMDFKFIGVDPGQFMTSGLFNGLFAQIRSFESETEGGSTSGTFLGERNVPTRFRQHFAPDVWHNVTDRVEIPAGGEFTDIRVSVNTFTNGWLFQGQILIDNVKLIRLSADFDDDMDVDATDLNTWKGAFGTTTAGDADGDGDSDGDDFLAWQQEVGLTIPEFLPPPEPPVPALPALAAIPEPSTFVLAAGAVLAAGLRRQRDARRSSRVVSQC